jgi:hypothetical protein
VTQTKLYALMSISPNRGPSWTEDLSAIYFGIRPLKKSDAKPDPKADPKAAAPEAKPETPPAAADAASDEEKPNLILWHYKDPRLQSQQRRLPQMPVQKQRCRQNLMLSLLVLVTKKLTLLKKLEQVPASA